MPRERVLAADTGLPEELSPCERDELELVLQSLSAAQLWKLAEWCDECPSDSLNSFSAYLRRHALEKSKGETLLRNLAAQEGQQ